MKKNLFKKAVSSILMLTLILVAMPVSAAEETEVKNSMNEQTDEYISKIPESDSSVQQDLDIIMDDVIIKEPDTYTSENTGENLVSQETENINDSLVEADGEEIVIEDINVLNDDEAKALIGETNIGDNLQAASMENDIPENALFYNGHYYYVYEIDANWAQAEAYCESLGGYLATITSQEENDAIFQYLLENGYHSAFFGFTNEKDKGTWRWVTGEETSYLNWADGEPNDQGGNEDYAMFYHKFPSGKWNDGNGYSIDSNGPCFICEWGSYKRFNDLFDYVNDTWKFSNPSSKISVSTYQMFFDEATAKELQSQENGTRGHCAGMVMSTMASYLGFPRISSYGNYRYLNEIKKNTRSSETNCKAINYIDYGFAYQFTEGFQAARSATRNDYEGLYEAVYDFQNNNGAPVYVSIGNDDGGHALMGLEVSDETSRNPKILVYDCNHPNQKRYITLFGTKGSFYGWSYDIDSSINWNSSQSGARINYITMASDFIGDYRSSYAADKNASIFMKIKKWMKGIFNYSDNWIDLNDMYGYDSDEIISIMPDTGINNSSEYSYWLCGDEQKVLFEDVSENSEITLAKGTVGISASNNMVSDISIDMKNASIQMDGNPDSEFQVSYENSIDYNNSILSSIEGGSDSVINVQQPDSNTLILSGTDEFSITCMKKTDDEEGNSITGKKQYLNVDNADSDAIYQITEDTIGNEISIAISEDKDRDGIFESVVASTKELSTISLNNKAATYTGKEISIDKASVTGSSGVVTYSYFYDPECQEKMTSAPVSVGTYYVIAKVESDDFYASATSNVAKLVITKAKVSNITLKKNSYTYSGKVQKPGVVVKDNHGNVLSPSDYLVSYSDGCKKIGKYSVTVTMKGNYMGSISKSFSIVPKGTSILKLRASSKGFVVKWKKQTKQITGYQIQYSTSKNFTKGKKVTISKKRTTRKAVKHLKAMKNYYVRVRTYKKVGKNKYYSSWSKVKRIKTKK